MCVTEGRRWMIQRGREKDKARENMRKKEVVRKRDGEMRVNTT